MAVVKEKAGHSAFGKTRPVPVHSWPGIAKIDAVFAISENSMKENRLIFMAGAGLARQGIISLFSCHLKRPHFGDFTFSEGAAK